MQNIFTIPKIMVGLDRPFSCKGINKQWKEQQKQKWTLVELQFSYISDSFFYNVVEWVKGQLRRPHFSYSWLWLTG